jgi:hypothetical protein
MGYPNVTLYNQPNVIVCNSCYANPPIADFLGRVVKRDVLLSGTSIEAIEVSGCYGK